MLSWIESAKKATASTTRARLVRYIRHISCGERRRRPRGGELLEPREKTLRMTPQSLIFRPDGRNAYKNRTWWCIERSKGSRARAGPSDCSGASDKDATGYETRRFRSDGHKSGPLELD